MADTNLTDQTFTQSDGYVMEYNLYYNTTSGKVPVVLFMHGSGGNKGNSAATAQAFRDAGFTAITVDVRGQGDGKAWIDGQSLTSADYGFGQYSTRDLADMGAIINEVISSYGDVCDPEKIGLLGTSQGANLSYMMATVEGKTIQGVKMPRIGAICPNGLTCDQLESYLVSSLDKKGRGGRVASGRSWAAFEDVSSSYYNLDEPIEALKTAVVASVDDAIDVLREGTSKAQRFPWLMSAGESCRPDLPMFISNAFDDRWGGNNKVIDMMLSHPNSFLHIGAQGSHGSTDVDGQSTEIDTRRLVFMRYWLKGEDVFGDQFSDSDPAKADRVTMLIVPNNTTDFQDETAPPYSDTTYSWTEISCNKPEWLYLFGDESHDGAEQQAQTTTVYLGSASLVTSAGTTATDTLDNDWSTATTAADVQAWIEAGNSTSDLDSYISGRITLDALAYSLNWLNASESTYAGIATLKLWASSDTAGAQLYAKIQYSPDAGSTWLDVADTQHIWADDYVPGTIEELDLAFNLRTMHLAGGAGSAKQIRLVIANYAPYELEWVDSSEPLRFTPDFTSGVNISIYRGADSPSRLILPLHTDTLTDLRP